MQIKWKDFNKELIKEESKSGKVEYIKFINSKKTILTQKEGIVYLWKKCFVFGEEESDNLFQIDYKNVLSIDWTSTAYGVYLEIYLDKSILDEIKVFLSDHKMKEVELDDNCLSLPLKVSLWNKFVSRIGVPGSMFLDHYVEKAKRFIEIFEKSKSTSGKKKANHLKLTLKEIESYSRSIQNRTNREQTYVYIIYALSNQFKDQTSPKPLKDCLNKPDKFVPLAPVGIKKELKKIPDYNFKDKTIERAIRILFKNSILTKESNSSDYSISKKAVNDYLKADN